MVAWLLGIDKEYVPCSRASNTFIAEEVKLGVLDVISVGVDVGFTMG